jgi:hypothetical protein
MSCDCFQQSAQGLSLHLVMDSSGEAKHWKTEGAQRTKEREKGRKERTNAACEYLAAQSLRLMFMGGDPLDELEVNW